MILIFLIFGSATLALFLFYSFKVGSVVNAITIFTGLKVAIEFIFEPIGFALHLFAYDTWAMLIVNALSFCGYAAFVIGLLATRQPPNPPRHFGLPNHLPLAWLLLVAAWFAYAPILIEFRAYVFEPRRIYELTRTGYGLYTFGSSLLTFCAYIVFQISNRRGALLFYVVMVTLILLKGSKGQFVILASIFIISCVYLHGLKYSLSRSSIYFAIIGALGLYVFALNFRGDIDNIFVSISEYSDYNRNGSLVVDSDTFGSYGGKLTMEMQWVPKVPRAIWPNKPKAFGEFRLAAQYFPQWFLLDQGSPSFGIGIYFADFGWWAFLIFPAVQYICGLLLGICLGKLIIRPNVFYFVVSVYLSGNNLLASGAGNYLIEHVIIGGALLIILTFMRSAPSQPFPLRQTIFRA
ncbi:hypothetical protein FSB78_14480 [Sphingomonas ginsenosidivorax]|uniref:Oligosaccharide repeat unit polymerase n=1 Tax=Sphingomonas ginsenosidivorax TaxID=862135 RepID=A0A5C6UIG9_9SPHN|nr:hypothetical protein [Sphingomonas ginsenosidivorax]TXC72021.1 hypothetical protein FSB78_14480 [Sphingomonas ginsenosidivorax]